MLETSKKKVLFILSVCIIFVIGITCYSGTKQYKIIINQKELATSSQPFNSSGRIMIPMRDIFEALEAKVDWNPKERMVIANKPNYSIELKIDSKVAKVNGRTVNLDVPATIKLGKTFVPVRFIAESLDMDVSWNGNSVIINNLKAANTPVPSITSTPTPIITNTPTLSAASTPLPKPSYAPADIKFILNGNEFNYKQFGENRIVISDGVLYGDMVISIILGMDFDYQWNVETKLKRRSDGTYLKTRVIDDRWFPIVEAARELNYQVEFKNNILTINIDNGNSNGNNGSNYYLDQTIPVNVSVNYSTTPLASNGGVTVLAICTAMVSIEIQKEEGLTRLKSLDDNSIKKILYDFYQNSTSFKECTYINISVDFNGKSCFQINITQGQPVDNATFQRLI